MSTIHWLGTGLSSIPGLRRLAEQNYSLLVWNRSVEKAQQQVKTFKNDLAVNKLDVNAIASAISSGDIVVSMLPATLHLDIAKACLNRKAHFVSSSYISQDMQDLDDEVKANNLCFVNETGLDPGLDHLLAHSLMQRYQASECFNKSNHHFFRSYCGGFPKIPNDFKYKFSWSPLGVLRALKSSARWIENAGEQTTQMPFKSLTSYKVNLPSGEEIFQAFPNRDSIPFMAEYGFDKDWRVDEFIRGTLRLNGWDKAWQFIFDEIENIDPSNDDSRFAALSDELWHKYAYTDNEPDRVVLSVELEVTDGNNSIWHQQYCIDAAGNDKGSAMARLVSYPVSLAVESILSGDIKAGVTPAPKDSKLVDKWLQSLSELGEKISLKIS